MPRLSKSDQAAKVSQNEARRRKEVALAKTRELDLKLKEESVLHKAAVRAVWSEHLAQIRDTFLAVPDRIAESLANQPAAAVREILGKEIEDALRILSDPAI